MTDEQWDTFAMLLDKGFKWREQFGPAHEFTYRTLLDGYDPEQVATALRALIARGQVFGPTPGEIVAEIRLDPSVPTFEEAFRLIYGRGGVLAALPPYTGPGSRTPEKVMEARRLRLAEVHPLVQSFVQRFGMDRLWRLEVNHDEYGDRKRKDLLEAWERHCVACEGRDVAVLASGARRERLGRLDPLAAIGAERRELEAGS